MPRRPYTETIHGGDRHAEETIYGDHIRRPYTGTIHGGDSPNICHGVVLCHAKGTLEAPKRHVELLRVEAAQPCDPIKKKKT